MKIQTNRDYKRSVDNKMKCYGETDLEKKTIRINKKKSKDSDKRMKTRGEVLDTIVHEELHASHPKMHERTVRKHTRPVMSKLSHKQKSVLYAKYR